MKQAPITETDLQAYVDDQLDAAGRLEVADYLVRHPDVAARVLADLGLRDAMRALATTEEDAVPAYLADEARRLDAALGRRRIVAALGRTLPVGAAVAVAVIAAATWQVTSFTPRANAAVPALVEEALMSKKTALMRAHIRSKKAVIAASFSEEADPAAA